MDKNRRCFRPVFNLLYAQMVKRREKGRVVGVTHKIIFGAAQQIEALLPASAINTTINTSVVEREHQSLRQRLPEPDLTRGSGTPHQWHPVTPAMAAGMTEWVGTTAELLGYSVPATFLDKLTGIEPLFPDPDSVHHVN